MDGVNIEARGLSGMMRRFANFGRRVGAQLRDTVRKVTRNIEERARREHRFTSRTGHTERSIEASTRSNGDGAEGEVVSRDKIAIFLMRGTRPHPIPKNIVSRRKKALRWADGQKFIFAKKVYHPGTKADPFLVNAFEKETLRFTTRLEAIIRQIWAGC